MFLVLLAVLALLAVNGFLLIPALLLSYKLTGIPWRWHGALPDPSRPPGPWMSLFLGLLASLLLAIVNGLALGFGLRRRTSR